MSGEIQLQSAQRADIDCIASTLLDEEYSYREFVEKMCTEGMCPYEIAKRLIERARVVIMTYHYIFSVNLPETVPIDLEKCVLVIDEAHKLAKNTERYKLGEVLAKKCKYMYLLTATPHKGDDEDYVARMRLIDPYIKSVDSAKHLVIRNLKDDVVDIDGRGVFPPRNSNTVEVPISPEEEEIHRLLDKYIANKLHHAKLKGDSHEINSTRFLGIILRKRASSSLYALKISLENRIRKMGYEPQVDIDKLIKDLREAEEEFDEDTRDRMEQELLNRLILPQEVREISEIVRMIDSLGDKDSKFEKLLEMITRIKTSDPQTKIIVFTGIDGSGKTTTIAKIANLLIKTKLIFER